MERLRSEAIAELACGARARHELERDVLELIHQVCEREVLGDLHLGYTNEQIARALGTAPRTVRNQLSRVYEKLGVSGRAEAVAASLCRAPG